MAVAFALFLVGFGIKLGMWPFGQVWLPGRASGRAVAGERAAVRRDDQDRRVWPDAVFPLAGAGGGAGGLPGRRVGHGRSAVLGTITLFTGTVQALRQDQTKRLLAFSSIGQGGYILFGLGVCLTLLASPRRRLRWRWRRRASAARCSTR